MIIIKSVHLENRSFFKTKNKQDKFPRNILDFYAVFLLNPTLIMF